MKIVIDKDIPFIKGRIPLDVEQVYMAGNEISPEKVKDADALIVRTRTKCDRRLLENSNVKLVATATIGTDHIDVPWCESNGITVKSAPGCNAPGVAQYVWASLLAEGFDSSRLVLGIVGYGNVGRIVAEWAKALGVKTLITDEPRKVYGYKDVEYLPMTEVLEKSDAVTLHVPFTKEGTYPTYKLIGEKEIDLMKRGAILVNSSRGGVVEEASLKKRLRGGELKAVVDVWENEPMIDTELVALADITTPHIAGYSEEGKKRGTRMALEAVRDVLGIEVNLEGLECKPVPAESISREIIENSYDPVEDSKALKRDISAFESLRNNYDYRCEV